MATRVQATNLDSLKYTPAPGVEYELAPGVVRTMKKAVYSLRKAHMELLAKESMTAEPGDDNYLEDLRIEHVKLITEGDDMPEDLDLIDFDVLTRAIGDFFTMRTLTTPRPSASSVTTNETHV